VSFIDIDTMEISDALSIGGMVVGVVLSTIFPSWYSAQISSDTVLDHLDALVYSIVGVASGSGLMFWIAILGEMAFKKEAVGFGDIKLMGMIGSFIRWNGCLFAIFGGCLICGIIALPILIFLKVFKGKDFKMSGEIPFAPFIVVGSVAYVLYGQDLIAFVCGTGY
jgi:leader peptidase (prepilin peptidase)/N-methyltransferase